MQSAFEQFHISLGRVRDLIALHNSLKAQSTQVLDLSDILRSALVLAVSALDYYVHEAVTLEMLEIYRGQRAEPPPSRNSSRSGFGRFQVPLGEVKQERLTLLNIEDWLEDEICVSQGEEFLEGPYRLGELLPYISQAMSNRLGDTLWLELEIRQRLGYQSFQHPDKIAEAIRLISNKPLWQDVGESWGRSHQEIKKQLSLIVERRNKIAHEADINPTYEIGTRWEINEELVLEAVDFLQKLVETIHDILNSP
ncbi:MAG: hypothetical protein EYR95_02190 [Phormidium sp. SL48-SHIP]|nr:MAG: hypothetical protein EYR95_02190 [Phormidium sp. SL48-SHIP]